MFNVNYYHRMIIKPHKFSITSIKYNYYFKINQIITNSVIPSAAADGIQGRKSANEDVKKSIDEIIV